MDLTKKKKKLLISINRCKNNKKEKERLYDYCIILLKRIMQDKNEKRKGGARMQQKSHRMDRKTMDLEKTYKGDFGMLNKRASLHMKYP